MAKVVTALKAAGYEPYTLRFNPVDEFEWRIVFEEKPNEDLTVPLI